jgi:hypothetical protein
MGDQPPAAAPEKMDGELRFKSMVGLMSRRVDVSSAPLERLRAQRPQQFLLQHIEPWGGGL